MTAHPPIDYLIPKEKLYLSCKSFSTVGSLPVAHIPFQLLCSEWSQIPAGWPLKQWEPRTAMKADQSSRISSIQFPTKRLLLAVTPDYAGMGAAQSAAPPAIPAFSP